MTTKDNLQLFYNKAVLCYQDVDDTTIMLNLTGYRLNLANWGYGLVGLL